MSAYLAQIAFAAGLLLIGSYGAFGQERQDDALGIEELRVLASNRPARVSTLRVSYHVLQEPASNSLAGHIPLLSQSVLVDATTGRFSVDRSMEIERAGQGASHETVTLAFDGHIQAAFLPDQMMGIVKQGADAHGLAESGLWGVMMLGEPQPDGLGIDDGSLESLLARGIVRDQLELVGEAPCHVVDAFYEGVRYATVWLDVERDLLPMKRVSYGRDGVASSTVTVDSVVFREDEQIWLPQSWQTEIQARGETLRTYTVVEPALIEINPPVTDEDFRVQFPPGTVVTDHISGRTYRIADSGEIGEILYERSNGEWRAVAAPIIPTNNDRQGASSPPAPLGAEPTSPGAATGRQAPDSKRPARAAPAAPAPVEVKPPSASRGRPPLLPAESPESDGATAVRAPPSRSPWPWILGAATVVALLGIAYSVWRRSVKTRLRVLLGVGLLVVAFAVWRAWVYVPAPGVAQYVNQAGRPPAPGAAAARDDDYELADGEIIRHIPAPDPEARRRLMRRCGWPWRTDLEIVSMIVVWDGTPRLEGQVVGSGIGPPPRLFYVLIHSLKIPLYRLEGIEVAWAIGLSGDWVVRADADLDQCMTYVEKVVQQSGYPDFRVVRTVQKRTAHEMHGTAQAPEQPIEILQPHPKVPPPVHPRTGTLREFGQELSNAIRRPVSIPAELQDLKLAWRDNSPAYFAHGENITNDAISNLLNKVAAALGVTFTESEVEMTVWQLELNK